jgi:hypothetical protein
MLIRAVSTEKIRCALEAANRRYCVVVVLFPEVAKTVDLAGELGWSLSSSWHQPNLMTVPKDLRTMTTCLLFREALR